MKLLKKILLFISVLIVTSATAQEKTSPHFYYIPTQTIQPYILIGYNKQHAASVSSYYNDRTKEQMKFEMSMKAFEISDQITFGEYKKYLSAIKKDSSATFFYKQLPDSSIATPEIYKQYVTGNTYDKYPVLGISWENALNYCKWKTLQDNRGDSISFIYRLPICSEWLAANDYLNKKKNKNDFNKNYADWLMSSKFEGSYGKDSSFFYDTYFSLTSRKSDAHIDRRFVIGNSYLLEKEKLYDYYKYNYFQSVGYRQIGFRIIKVKYSTAYSYKAILKFWGLSK